MIATEVSMKAALMNGARDIRFGVRAKRVPRMGKVLIRVQANSICGSDLHYYHEGQIGGDVMRTPPLAAMMPTSQEGVSCPTPVFFWTPTA